MRRSDHEKVTPEPSPSLPQLKQLTAAQAESLKTILADYAAMRDFCAETIESLCSLLDRCEALRGETKALRLKYIAAKARANRLEKIATSELITTVEPDEPPAAEELPRGDRDA
jgi:hypothetical protein